MANIAVQTITEAGVNGTYATAVSGGDTFTNTNAADIVVLRVA